MNQIENWKKVVGYENYSISDQGNVRKDKNMTLKKQTPDKDGYLTTGIRKNKKTKMSKVHRLVASAFIPNPENKKSVDHINNDRKNVFFANSAIKRISSQTQAQIRPMIRLPYFICFALFTICMVIWVMHPASVTAYIVGAWWSQAFLWLGSLVDNFGSLVMDLVWPHLHVN